MRSRFSLEIVVPDLIRDPVSFVASRSVIDEVFCQHVIPTERSEWRNLLLLARFDSRLSAACQ
jgi:hypothetical protein